MDYNKFTYYRANPYANQGYMPPTAFINRHRPDFITQLPMGQQHLGKIGRKQYNDNAHHKSSIDADNLLKSPERYPYENRIAFDKNYQRNLNTIDIQGASGGTLVSQAVKNKMKAREELLRRQQSEKISQNQILNMAQVNQQERRRKLAYTQYLRDQQLKQINENKQRQQKQQKQQRNSLINSNLNNSKILSPNQYNAQNVQNPSYMNNLNNKNYDMRYSPLLKPRYQSIQVNRQRDNSYDRQYRQDYQQRYGGRRQSVQYGNMGMIDKSVELSSRNLTKESETQSGTAQRNRETPYLPMPTDRKSLRLQNPTNLSSEGSLNLAARNIVKGQ